MKWKNKPVYMVMIRIRTVALKPHISSFTRNVHIGQAGNVRHVEHLLMDKALGSSPNTSKTSILN